MANKIKKRVGRPRTSKTATEKKREYDRLRMQLKSQYKKAGLDWQDYKERFTIRFLKKEIMKGIELHPKSPVSIAIKKNMSEALRISFRERIKFMQNIADKGHLIGVKNALEKFYQLEKSTDDIIINNKKYKHLNIDGVDYGLHNGTIKVLKAEKVQRKQITKVEHIDDYDDDYIPTAKEYASYFTDFDEDNTDIYWDFDDEFEGAEYKGDGE